MHEAFFHVQKSAIIKRSKLNLGFSNAIFSFSQLFFLKICFSAQIMMICTLSYFRRGDLRVRVANKFIADIIIINLSIMLIVIILGIIINSIDFDLATGHCVKGDIRRDQNLTVYWINLDSSVDRKKFFENQLLELNLVGNRVSALTPADLDIPDNHINFWHCVTGRTSNVYIKTSDNNSDRKHVLISELCGRPK